MLALFQLDACDEADAAEANLQAAGLLADAEVNAVELTPGERERALSLAASAYAQRAEADAEFEALAPGWPARRQAAVDRAILRLARHELVGSGGQEKGAINDAVELAKDFSTDKSPAFVNALLDKVLKRVQRAHAGGGAGGEEPGRVAEGQSSGGDAAPPHAGTPGEAGGAAGAGGAE